MKSSYQWFFVFIIFAYSSVTSAETAEEKALKIATQADRNDTGYIDERMNVDMVLLHRDGTRLERNSHWRVKERSGDGDMRLYVFDTPIDQRGAAILSHGHIDRADEQWLYLPGIKKTIKVANENRSGSFVGSEFSYEDINSQEIPKFKWKYLREDVLRGRKVHVSERRPIDPHSGYSKQHLWVDQEHLYTMRIESFDRKGEPLKTAEITGWQKIDGFWRQGKISLTNLNNKNTSILIFKNRVIGAQVPDSDFDVGAFSKGETLFNHQ